MQTTQPALAMASVKSVLTWSWILKVDSRGLFRWYLNGNIETHLRGCSAEQAESALRRFVERSLQGELQITGPGDRIGPGTERWAEKQQSQETAC
jgi:hypothetical protein